MPVEDIVDYFNDHFRRKKIRFLPDEPLVVRGSEVQGRFGGFALRSRFQTVASQSADGIEPLGEQAITELELAQGTSIPLDQVLNRIDQPLAVVYVDRLCRMVHMLNFLMRNPLAGSELLLVAVDHRHVLSVAHDHGRYFEAVLSRCGLEPANVVLSFKECAQQRRETLRVASGVLNYRARGYRTAVALSTLFGHQGHLESLFRLPPDLVILEPEVMTEAMSGEAWMRQCYRSLVSTARLQNARVLQAGVDNEEQHAFVGAAGVEWLTGQVVESLRAGQTHRSQAASNRLIGRG